MYVNRSHTVQVTKGGAAESTGELAVGMRIVEVNGISLLGASHTQAVKALRSSPELLITVCNGFDVREVMRRKSLADQLEDDTFSSVTVGSHGQFAIQEMAHEHDLP